MDYGEKTFQAGCVAALDTLIGALTRQPGASSCTALYELAGALDPDIEARPWDELMGERFQQRLLVPGNPLFIPLCEQAVRSARVAEGIVAYGSLEGEHARHVAACYRELGFDWRGLRGFEPLVASLRADSLASELYFLRSLTAEEACSADPAHAAWCRSARTRFMGEHTLPFLRKLCELLAEGPQDYLTDAIALALALLESVYELEERAPEGPV